MAPRTPRPNRILETELLSREAFNRAVLERSRGLCVFCGEVAVDPHHILDRKLFPDGGYYLANVAAVCAEHHWQCETTALSVEQVRLAAGITRILLPPGLAPTGRYDKWGNRIWDSGLRTWGPLHEDTGAKRALAMGGFAGLMMPPAYTEDG